MSEDLTLRILVDIQAKLADHTRRFDAIDERLGKIDRRLTTLVGVGLTLGECTDDLDANRVRGACP